MYNLSRFGIASVVLTLGACGSFGEDGSSPGSEAPDAGATETGSAAEGGGRDMDGGDADAARTDASIGDSSIDPADDAGILPVVGVACGSTTCAIGEGCCLSSKSPVCTKHSACTGFFIACTAQSACGGGARCCFDGAQASCATSCAGKNPICASSGDCVQGQCAPLSCDVDASAPTTPLRLCWNDAATQLSRDGLTCSLP